MEIGARGNLIPDAYLAAMAIESGCEWITTDKGEAAWERAQRRVERGDRPLN